MPPMVSHRTSIYIDPDELSDAAVMARSRVQQGHVDKDVWRGVLCALVAIQNYRANSAEEFIEIVAQEIEHTS